MITIFIRSGSSVKNLENRVNEELMILAQKGYRDEDIKIEYSLCNGTIQGFQCTLINVNTEIE